MSKNNQLIMAVKREILFSNNDYFEGFKAAAEIDYESRILKNFQCIERSRIEDDPEYKQPIGYSIIVNPLLKQVFVYQRGVEDTKYHEKRLQGKWSWGVGGHITQSDIKTENPIYGNIFRELKHEIGIRKIGIQNPYLTLLGYINNDTDDVGKVHFGMVYIVEINSRNIKPKSPEIKEGQLRKLEELEKICLSPEFIVEEWSKIVLNPLKSYIAQIVFGNFLYPHPVRRKILPNQN